MTTRHRNNFSPIRTSSGTKNNYSGFYRGLGNLLKLKVFFEGFGLEFWLLLVCFGLLPTNGSVGLCTAKLRGPEIKKFFFCRREQQKVFSFASSVEKQT